MTIHRNLKFILDTRDRIYDDATTPLVDVAHLADFADSDYDSDAESDCYSDDSSLGGTRHFYDDDDEVMSESVASYINALFPSVEYRQGEESHDAAAESILRSRLEALIEQLSRDDERSPDSSKLIEDDDSLVLNRRLRSPSRRKEKRNHHSSSLGDSLHLARCTVPALQWDDAGSWENGVDDDDDDDFSEYFIPLKIDS